MPVRSRAVAPVVSTIILVGVVAILAATISVIVVGFGEDLDDPAPTVGQASGEFVGGTGSTNQVVRISHIAGDNVDVSEIEITVTAPQCDVDKARIVNLPVQGSFSGFDVQYGSDLIDQTGKRFAAWEFGVLHADTDNVFESGSFFEFRLNSRQANCGPGGGGFTAGDRVTVRVVHTPTDAVIIEEELRAT